MELWDRAQERSADDTYMNSSSCLRDYFIETNGASFATEKKPLFQVMHY